MSVFRFSILFSVFFLLVFSFCVPQKVRKGKPPIFSFDILYGANLSYRDLPKFNWVKRTQEGKGASLVLLDSKVFQGDFLYLGERSFIFSLIKFLNGMGVDGVIVNSDFLPLFQKMGRGILDSSHFFLLAANLFRKERGKEDRAETKRPVFHPLLNKTLNGERITLLSILSNFAGSWDDYYWEEPETFLKKRITLLREKKSLVGCIVDTAIYFSSPPCFFIERPKRDSLIRYQITFDGNNFQVISEGISLSGADEVLAESILFLGKRIDSFLDSQSVEIKETFSREGLENELLEFILRKAKADFFVREKPLVEKGVRKGKMSRRDFGQVLGEKGFLTGGELSWREIERLGKEKGYLIFPKLRKRSKDFYRVVTTKGVLEESAHLFERLFYLPDSFFELALEFLRR